MSDIYIQDSALKLSLCEGRMIVRNDSREIVEEIGLDEIENVLIFGQSQLTTQLLKKLSLKKINTHFFTDNGRYIATVDSGREENFTKQEQQAKAHFNIPFRTNMARRMLSSKVQNQMNLLKAFDQENLLDEEDYQRFSRALKQISLAESIHEMMGYEGKCAKSYFYFLGLLVPEPFAFSGRTRRPAMDCFNSLLNFGYSILYSFMIGMVRKAGLSQGFAMIHENYGHHASLASDLMEEWRPVIVDDLVMTMLGNGSIGQDSFAKTEEGLFLTREAQRLFLTALSSRMLEIHSYIEGDKKRYSFIYMVEMQIDSLIRAFAEEDPSVYLVSFTGE